MIPAQPAPPLFFLPDFCNGRTALAIVLIAESVALLIALARQPVTHNFWGDLSSLSIFLLWIGLGSALVLCRANPRLAKQSIATASVFALTLIAAVVIAISEAVYQIGAYLTGGIPSALSVFPEDHVTFVLRNASIGFIVSAAALRYFYISAEWKRTTQLEAQARIHALQARIRPHFLFNSMNTIAALTRSNPIQAEQAVEDLADLFRANLSDAKQQIRLSEELEVARVYQRIEQLRLGDRLRVEWHVESLPMDALVPSLLLQPLLENAIYHGIERLPNGGTVVIGASFNEGEIRLWVANPLSTTATTTVEHDGNRLALDNIKQRLQLSWPGKAGIDVKQTADDYSVTLFFPYSKRES